MTQRGMGDRFGALRTGHTVQRSAVMRRPSGPGRDNNLAVKWPVQLFKALWPACRAAAALPLALTFLLLLAPAVPVAARPLATAAPAARLIARPTPIAQKSPAAPRTLAVSQTVTTTVSAAPLTSVPLTSHETAAAPIALPETRPFNAPEPAASSRSSLPTPTATPSSPYRLPWPGGETISVVQGNNGAFSHTGLEAFAWDFSMPTGAIIEAARGGVVRYVRDDSNAGGDDVNLFGPAANYIVIDHGDGTSGLYMHLMDGGALVHVGEQVQQGQPIAENGGTGYATGPHLHFMVERTEPGVWYDQSLPISFADVTTDKGVPQQNQAYTSGNAPHTPWQASNVINRIELPAVTLPSPAASPVPTLKGTGLYVWPLVGDVIDAPTAKEPVAVIGGANGAPVVAADTGTVVFAGTDGPSVTVEIDHGDGAVTLYARLSRAVVLAGDVVQRGQPIGQIASLAPGLVPHLAVALYVHGQAVNPLTQFKAGLPPAPVPQVTLPNLVGLTPAQATAALTPLRLTLASDAPQTSASIAPGLISAQQPAANTLVNVQSVVHVAPSLGPPTQTPTTTPTRVAQGTADPTPTVSAQARAAASPVETGTPAVIVSPAPSATATASPSRTATTVVPAQAAAIPSSTPTPHLAPPSATPTSVAVNATRTPSSVPPTPTARPAAPSMATTPAPTTK